MSRRPTNTSSSTPQVQPATPIPTRKVTAPLKNPERKEIEFLTVTKPDGSRRTLTKRQKLFVEFYLRGNSAYKSAIMAGYPDVTARASTSAILDSEAVATEINRRGREKFRQLEIDSNKVLEETAKLAFSNVLDYIEVDNNGNFTVDLRFVNRSMGAAIQEIGYDVQGRPKIRLADKKSALELLARIFKMLKDTDPTESDETKRPVTISVLDQIIQNITINQVQTHEQNQGEQKALSESTGNTIEAQ